MGNRGDTEERYPGRDKAHPVIGGQQRDHMTREVALGTVGKSGGERGGWQGAMEQPLRESSALPADRQDQARFSTRHQPRSLNEP